jgi:uncharacterized protein YjbJ (UPF0337 family)
MADDLRKDGLKNQVKGAAKELGGKARSELGSMRGDSSQEIRGKVDEFKGKAQRKIGEAQSDVSRADRDSREDRFESDDS